MNLKYLFFVQVFVFSIQFTDSNPKPALDVAQVGLKVVQAIVGVASAISNYKSQQRIKVLLEELAASSRRIESTIKTEAQRIIDELSVEINMQKVHNFKISVDDINLRYDEEFWKYFMSNITYERETIERFVNDRDVVKQLGRSIRYHTVSTNVVPGVKDDRLFEILHNYLIREANNNRHCALGTSHYKVLYEAYNTAVSAVVKATVMILYSYKYLQQGNHDAWKSELEDVQSEYISTVANISAAARAVVARSSRAVTRCDPRTYVRGKNYMSYSFRSLYIRFPNILGLDRSAFLYPWQRSGAFCDGVTSGCTATRVIRACLAAPESGRRFETIIERGGMFDFSWYYKGPTVGEDRCEYDPMIAQYRQQSNDACFCNEPSTLKKNAYLNKSAVYSDVDNNRTRWAITYLEIQDGEMTNGSVLPETVRWREDVTHRLEDFERRHYVLPDDFNLGKDDEYTAIPDDVVNPNLDSSIMNLRRLDIKFNLDDIILPAGMVVTGVKFEESEYCGISLMIQGSEFFDGIGNFEFSHKRQWFSSDNYDRKQINLDKCGDPLRGLKQNKELSTPDESSVAFQLSDWNRDGSQSLIPFIDLQEVVTNPPSPIGGLGIFYKGQEDHGGFISLKIFDIDDTIFMFRGWFVLKELFEWLTGALSS